MKILEPSYSWAYKPGTRRTTSHLILHHAAADGISAETIHSWHLAKGWAGIAYHYYVRKDGTVYRGRPETWTGGHTTNWNYCSIGICFEGNFETQTMPTAQRNAGAALVADIMARYPGITVGRHKDYNSTACPGKNFPFDLIVGGSSEAVESPTAGGETTVTVSLRQLKNGSEGENVRALQLLLNGKNYNCGTVDGDFGSKTLQAVKSFQKATGLDVDGIVGKNTWTALLK